MRNRQCYRMVSCCRVVGLLLTFNATILFAASVSAVEIGQRLSEQNPADDPLDAILTEVERRDKPLLKGVKVTATNRHSVNLSIEAPGREGQQLTGKLLDGAGADVPGFDTASGLISSGRAQLTFAFGGAGTVSSQYLEISVQDMKTPFRYSLSHDFASFVSVLPRPADSATEQMVTGRREDIVGELSYNWMNRRLTNRDGWYDAVVDVENQPTHEACRRICERTARCTAFAVEGGRKNTSKANLKGGFCGLIFGRAHFRYDKAWVDASRNFVTGITERHSERWSEPARLALRSFVRGGPGDNTEMNLGPLQDWKVSRTAGEGFADCATTCLEKENCKAIVYKMGRPMPCQHSTKSNTNVPVINLFSIAQQNPKLLTYMKSVKIKQKDLKPHNDRRVILNKPINSNEQSLNTKKVYLDEFTTWAHIGEFDPQRMDHTSNHVPVDGSLPMFAPRAFSRLSPHYQEAVRDLSSAVIRGSNGKSFNGVEPPRPAAEDLPEDLRVRPISLVDMLNLNVDSTRVPYLPFQDTVWESLEEPGTYYFAPRTLRLHWDPINKKLGGSEFFKAVGTIGDGNAVNMHIQLSDSYTSRDRETFKKVVDAALTKSGMARSQVLKPFPVDTAPNADRIASALSGFAGDLRDKLKIVTRGDDASAQLDIQFTVSDLDAENLMTNLADADGQGINGSIDFHSTKLNDHAIVNFSLDARDPLTYGGEEIRDNIWVNPSPFPAKMLTVHALIVGPDESEVFTWEVDAPFINPGEQIKLDTERHVFPAGEVYNAARVWADYKLDRSCVTCAREALGVAGVTSEARSNVEFVARKGLVEELGMEEIVVFFRSRYLNVDGDATRNSPPIVLNPEGLNQVTPPLYLPDDQQLGGDTPVYSYRAILHTAEGECLTADWRESDRPRIRFSSQSFHGGIGDACPATE